MPKTQMRALEDYIEGQTENQISHEKRLRASPESQMYRVDFQILYLCPKSKEKACISAGILKLMARFELATSSLPNGAEILISSQKTEQKR